ncbi:PaaX family transcriptional regulator C-terminal domain-containing protein [Gordonia soli]|uniref:PaaX domain-containing protein, C-domain protein n=1 Tax=Gordonia soli NBRC 108243 TaxID=1223545 RepID=M0QJM9_9ACTN|nr:PaaX family transcriptional regulator C-terminal domain-containing protein [Gordonia soli]GAC67642.1 hypothetical protein GS4_08_02270 [Gordonia soli NBRC 108243]
MSPARRPRSLSARSAILRVLLGAHPARASASGILSVATELGFGESAVRVALTRMVSAGDLERDNGEYRLAPRLIERQRRQDAAVVPQTRDWDGTWRLVVISTPAADAATRTATRDALRAAHLGELREGVWLRPDNLVGRAELPDDRATSMLATPDDDPSELAERLFATSLWAQSATELIADYADASTLADRFVVAAAIVRHILDDPLLPAALLPEGWPGTELRTRYDEFRREFADHAEQIVGDLRGRADV